MLNHDSMFRVMLALCHDREADTNHPQGERRFGVIRSFLHSGESFPETPEEAKSILLREVIVGLKLDGLPDESLAWIIYITAIDDGLYVASVLQDHFQDMLNKLASYRKGYPVRVRAGRQMKLFSVVDGRIRYNSGLLGEIAAYTQASEMGSAGDLSVEDKTPDNS